MNLRDQEKQPCIESLPQQLDQNPPLFVGNAIHTLDQHVYSALRTRDNQMLSDLVQKQLDAGANALAVNFGPGKEMAELTPWAVQTIREITDVPLFVSASIIDQQQALAEHRHHIVINAVTANREELGRGLSVARDNGNALAVLLVRAGAVTGGIESKVQLACEVLDEAVTCGFPLSRLYLDPVLSCRPDPAALHVSRGLPDIGSVLETISLIRQLDSRIKTVTALANRSEYLGKKLQSAFHSRMLSLLAGAGLDAVLLNCFDEQVMRTAYAVQGCSPSGCNGLPDREQVSSAA